MTSVSHRLTDLGYATAWRLVPALPRAAVDAAFGIGADVAVRRDGDGVRQLRRNLARVVPQAGAAELDELTRRALRSYARYWQEAFRLPAMDTDRVHRAVTETITGVENLNAALAAGNGVVVALPHSGNWDAIGVWLTGQVGEFSTVVERLEPAALYERFVAYRRRLGFDVVAADGDAGSYRRLLQRLRSGGIVCLLGDRDLTRSGVRVEFFGEPTRMPGGPARLAASTGAALLPVGTWFTPQGWGTRLHPPIRVNAREEVPAATQALADVFAGDIAAHPTDWHMLQKIWLADLSSDALADADDMGAR